ncbi:hypothetical protein PtA15_3A234 [Puccinia triticina]|uniref:Uncharacterized protein n=1 Tax=Puccinia triticina TaxID=208348 RepID=A0ABY7CDU7_9BASI|nr:uncharacterized protein PtA15_3A234 [Puccinia triticina]WAQ82869.1 hypothetical protein PtA15_3A234 [Puccinia triticina]
MSRFSAFNSFGDPQDHATNSATFNSTKQMQQESSANQLRNSSPLTTDDANNPSKHGPSTLHSGFSATSISPTGQHDNAGAHSLNGSPDLPFDTDSPLTELANTVGSDANSPNPQVINPISQAISNIGPLPATSNSAGNLPTTPTSFDSLHQASSATSTGPTGHADHSAPAPINNDISSLFSSLPTTPTSSQPGKPSRKGKPASDLTSGLQALPIDPLARLESSDTGSYQKGQSRTKTNNSQLQPNHNSLTGADGDQINQNTSAFGPLLDTSNADDKTHTVLDDFAPSPKSSKAASGNPTRHADQSTHVPSTQSARITQGAEISSNINGTSSVSSSFPASLASSQQQKASAKGKSAADDMSELHDLPADFPGSFDSSVTSSYGNDRTPQPIDNSRSQVTPQTEITREESTQLNATAHGQSTVNEKAEWQGLPGDLPGSASVIDNNGDDRRPKNVDNSRWKTTPQTTTTREEYSSQQQETANQQTNETSTSYPVVTSASSTASRKSGVKTPKDQASQVSSSDGRSGDGLGSLFPGIIPTLNSTLSDLTAPVDHVSPSEPFSSSAASRKPPAGTPKDRTSQVSSSDGQSGDSLGSLFPGIIPTLNSSLSDLTAPVDHVSPSEPFSSSAASRKPPAKDQTSQVSTPDGLNSPLREIIPTLNSTLSNLTSLVDLPPPCRVAHNSKGPNTQTFPQIGCRNSTELYALNQTGLGNLKSPAALQQSAQHSSGYSTKADLNNVAPLPINGNTGKNYYNTAANSKPPVNNQALSSDTAMGLNSSNLALGGLASPKTKSLDKEPPARLSALPSGGPSMPNNSSSSDALLQASMSSSSSTDTRTKETQDSTRTVSDSREPFLNSETKTTATNEQESSAKHQTSNEWRIAVQNSSSGFSGQQLSKTPARTVGQPLQDSKRIATYNSTQSFNLTRSHATSEQVDSSQPGKSVRTSTASQSNIRSSAHSQSSSTESSSGSPVRKEDERKSAAAEKSPASSSWIGQTLLPSSSPSKEQGYQVSTGGKITVISVGLGFSIGVLILALVGGVMKRRMLRKHRQTALQISRPKSQLGGEDQPGSSGFSSPRTSNIDEGLHPSYPSLDPEYQIPLDEEARIEPQRSGSYQIHSAGLRDRYDSYASSFGNFAPPRPDRSHLPHYSGQFASYPQEYLAPGPPGRRSDGTSVIPITFNQPHFGGAYEPRLGPLDFEEEGGYGPAEDLPHSGTQWIPRPHDEPEDDCGTEVATRFTSDGETMIEDGADVPPVPPLTWDRLAPVNNTQ